jgi:hypothetical protein
MAHVHDHNDSTYVIEQLCTIGVCGALGAVVITMWAIPNGLNFLGPQFQAPLGNPWLSPLFWGGVIIAAMVLVRALATGIIFRTARLLKEADGGRVHFWVPCHYVLALFPVGLYWLGLIPSAFSSHTAININLQDSGRTAATKDGEVIRSFLELGRAASTEELLRYYEGRTAQVIGQITNVETDRFGLVRYKVTCCAADALPSHLRVIVTDRMLDGNVYDARIQLADAKWVEVVGVIQFRKLRGTDEFVSVLEVKGKDVHIVPKPPANPFIY